MDVGGVHHGMHHQALGIDQDMPLLATDLFPRIIAFGIDAGPALYLAIAGRDEAGEAIGGREPAAPRGDRAREKAWRPVHRFQREPAQSPGPQTEPAFARTGHGTASR